MEKTIFLFSQSERAFKKVLILLTHQSNESDSKDEVFTKDTLTIAKVASCKYLVNLILI